MVADLKVSAGETFVVIIYSDPALPGPHAGSACGIEYSFYLTLGFPQSDIHLPRMRATRSCRAVSTGIFRK